MKRIIGLLCIVSFVLPILNAQAIDREARMIDRVSLDLAHLDDVDSIGGSILGETAIAPAADQWAVLFGGGMGRLSPLGGGDSDTWNVLLGLKFYPFRLTSVAAYGKYEEFQVSGVSRDARSATCCIKQRLLPAEVPVCPFVGGGLTVRDRSTLTDLGTQDSFSELLTYFGGGCEFAMNEEFSIVFEAYYQLAQSSDDRSEDLDGWLGTVSMVYYWNSAD